MVFLIQQSLPPELLAAVPALAAMGSLLTILLASVLVLYVYGAICLMKIAGKTRTPNGWLAFIPIANLYLITQVAGVAWWTMFAFLLSFIPAVGSIAFMVVVVWWWWKICENVRKPGWWSLLMLIPIVNLIVLGILAFGGK